MAHAFAILPTFAMYIVLKNKDNTVSRIHFGKKMPEGKITYSCPVIQSEKAKMAKSRYVTQGTRAYAHTHTHTH